MPELNAMFSAGTAGKLRRCFFAALPDREACGQLLAWQQALHAALGPVMGMPVQPVDLHLTLAFLGDLDGAAVQPLLRAWPASGLAARLPALEFTGLQRWGDRQSVWVAEFAAEPVWTEVQQALSTLLLRQGIHAAHATFCPHVTLGRGKRSAASPGRDVPAFKWPAASLRFDRLAMMARAGGEQTARYRVVHCFD